MRRSPGWAGRWANSRSAAAASRPPGISWPRSSPARNSAPPPTPPAWSTRCCQPSCEAARRPGRPAAGPIHSSLTRNKEAFANLAKKRIERTDMGAVEVPVLIVGGGGCGLSASVFLSGHGVGHLLVERHAGTSTIPKAHYLNQRTMEIFRQHGIDGAVAEIGAPLEKFGQIRWLTTLAGDGPLDARLIHEMDAFGGGSLRERYAEAGPILPVKLPQVRLEPVLREYAEQRNPGRIWFGHELTTFSDEGDHVVAEIRDTTTGEITTVTARYLIAADGGRTVGGALGVRMIGLPGLLDVTTAYFSADLSAVWWEGTLITHFLNPHQADLSRNLIEMGPSWGKDCEEWVLHLPPGGSAPFDEQEVISRIRAVLGLPHLEVDLHHVTNWRVEAL